eukprot:3199475-Alexandrium_andersonii.AAC.1
MPAADLWKKAEELLKEREVRSARCPSHTLEELDEKRARRLEQARGQAEFKDFWKLSNAAAALLASEAAGRSVHWPLEALKMARLRAYTKRMKESQIAMLSALLDKGLVQHAGISRIQCNHGAQYAVRGRNGHNVVLADGLRRCSVCRSFASTKGSLNKLLQRPCAGPPAGALERRHRLAAKWLEKRLEAPGLVHHLVAVAEGWYCEVCGAWTAVRQASWPGSAVADLMGEGGPC